MIVDIVEIVISTFHNIVEIFVFPLFLYFGLFDFVIGFFLTYSFYRFILAPLFGGHLKFNLPRGSDQADKKYHSFEHGKGK